MLEVLKGGGKKLMLMSNLQMFCSTVRISLPMTFLTFFVAIYSSSPVISLYMTFLLCSIHHEMAKNRAKKLLFPLASVSFVMLTWNERKEGKKEKNNQLVEERERWEKCGGCVIWISQTGTRNQMNERNESLCFSFHSCDVKIRSNKWQNSGRFLIY